MKYVDEFRDQAAVRSLLGQLRQSLTRHWTLMEVCGGQTHTFLKTGLLEMLPPEIELIHGPGCPVCVTAIELVDQAVAIAARPASFASGSGALP